MMKVALAIVLHKGFVAFALGTALRARPREEPSRPPSCGLREPPKSEGDDAIAGGEAAGGEAAGAGAARARPLMWRVLTRACSLPCPALCGLLSRPRVDYAIVSSEDDDENDTTGDGAGALVGAGATDEISAAMAEARSPALSRARSRRPRARPRHGLLRAQVFAISSPVGIVAGSALAMTCDGWQIALVTALSAGALMYATVHEVLTVPIVADHSKGLSIALQLGAVTMGYAGMSLLAICM